MSLFNTVVYCEENKIKVKLEQIIPVESENGDAVDPVAISVKSFASLDFQNKYPVFLDDEIKSTQLPRILFKAKDSYGFNKDEPEKEFYREAIIYEFPTDSTCFINFARVIDELSQRTSSSAALHRNISIDEWIKDGALTEGLYYFFDLIGYIDPPIGTFFKDEHRFIYNILDLENTPEAYQKPLQLLNSIMRFALCDYIEGKSEDNLISDVLLSFILSGRDPFILLDPEVSKTTKRLFIANLYTTFTPADQHEKLAYLFNIINAQAIKTLYEQCINKEAADGGKYSFTYTEWKFLHDAKFNIRADGRMSIIGLCNNEGYKQHYTKGQRLHDKFEEEMRYLGKIIGLEFAEDCDFHSELIFTEQCTQALKAKGLHYNELYLDKFCAKEALVQSRNTFFQPNVPELKKEETKLTSSICAIL